MKVKLLTRMDIDEEMLAALMHSTRVLDKDIEKIVGEQSDEKLEERLRKSIKWRHSTVSGMMDFIFLVEGVSRSFTHQLVRHRTAWFLQQSQRHLFIGELPVVYPDSVKEKAPELAEELDEHWREIYNEMAERGVPLEDARYFAPQGITTRIIMKIDGCNLIHFLNLRMSDEAQWEIRKVAELMYEEVKDLYPILFDQKLREYWW